MPETTIVSRFRFALLFICLSVIANVGYTQCITPQSRVYANSQNVSAVPPLTTVTNPGSAADGNITTYSTISRALGVGNLITVTQYLTFPAKVNAGTAVTIKVNLPTSLLSLLGGVEIQPFIYKTVLGSPVATATGKAITSSTLLSLINGAGDAEITITPQKTDGTAVEYNGVWIQLSGVALGQSIKVYDAYYQQDALGTVSCNSTIDVLSGVRASTPVGGIADALSGVTSPYNAIDADASAATYAEMIVGAQVLSEVFHTTIFSQVSQPGDFIRMVLQNPGGGLLSLTSLSGFTIQLYKGSTPVGSAISGGSGLLSLNLFPGSTDKYQLDIIPSSTDAFDRVDVQMGSLANVSLVQQGLRIYDVKRMIAAPDTKIDGATATSAEVCSGNTATLAVNTTQSCTTYKWYDADKNGNLLATGTSYTPSASSLTVGEHKYYVEASHSGCSEGSERTLVKITVNPLPGITITNNPGLCPNTATATLGYTATNSPATYSLTWSASALTAGFTNVVDAGLPSNNISVTIPADVNPGIYHGTLITKTSAGCAGLGIAVDITINSKPSPPVVSLSP